MKFNTFLVLLFLLVVNASAQTTDRKRDGDIIEQARFALPTHDQIPIRFKKLYSRELVDRIRNANDLELNPKNTNAIEMLKKLQPQ